MKSYTTIAIHRRLQALRKELNEDTSYDEWLSTVAKIDAYLGKDAWRRHDASKKYDYRLIQDRLATLRAARANRDTAMMVLLFSSGLIRNFGGITDRNLFNTSYLGTKILIHEYIEEVTRCLRFIADSPQGLSYKLRFFNNSKQTFGSTALVLQGGSMFGMYHLGVIKTLREQGLLPRVVSGSYYGAIFACLVCVTEDNESFDLGDALSSLVGERTTKSIPKIRSRAPEIDALIQYMIKKLGDVTFEELHLKGSRILNVVVYASDLSLPQLMNYVTTPNVVVRSAMLAALGSDAGGPILVKTLQSKVVPWKSEGGEMRFHGPHEARYASKSPYERMTELFNVNHFIVSLARLYFKPLVVNDIRHDMHFVRPLQEVDRLLEQAKVSEAPREGSWLGPVKVLGSLAAGVIASVVAFIATPSYTYITATKMAQKVVNMEIQYRFNLMADTSFFRQFLVIRLAKKLTVDERTPKLSSSEITIVPNVRDFTWLWFRSLFARQSGKDAAKENIVAAVRNGERSVWPLVPILGVRCSIEFELDKIYEELKHSELDTR